MQRGCLEAFVERFVARARALTVGPGMASPDLGPLAVVLHAVRIFMGIGHDPAIPFDEREGAYERYTGDAAVPGKGEILIWKPLAS